MRGPWIVIVILFIFAATMPAGTCADTATRPLRMGVFPRRNFNDTMRLFLPLAQELSRRLHRAVRLETTPDFPSFWRAVASGRFDIVHFNQYQYLRAHKEYGYRVFGMNEEFGHRSMRSVILVRRDSQLRSLRDLRGKRILFGGDRSAMLGYIAPTYLLRKAGLHDDDYRKEFATTPLNVGIAMVDRRADAGASSDLLPREGVLRERIDPSKLRILAEGRRIAGLPWALSPRLSKPERKRIARAMLDLGRTVSGRRVLANAELNAIVPARDADYDSARRMIRAVMHEDY